MKKKKNSVISPQLIHPTKFDWKLSEILQAWEMANETDQGRQKNLGTHETDNIAVSLLNKAHALLASERRRIPEAALLKQ